MKKPSSQTQEIEPVMSAHMRYACRNEIAKHKDFYEFLVSVWALKEKNGGYIVNEFHNDDLEKYHEKFVKKFEQSINDSFIFEKTAKRKRFDDKVEKETPTGYFCPMLFWKQFA